MRGKMNQIIIAVSIIVLTFVVPISSASQPIADPIDRIVQKLNTDKHDLWANGAYPVISFPANAKPETVIAQAVKMTGFDNGHIKTYKIVKIRRAKLNAHNMRNCSAALIESDLGTKVILFRYNNKSSWWTRFYDVLENK
jgi:hypothetical protein